MGTASGMINAMRAMLGTTEHPPGSNHNAITVWYNANVDKIGDGAWCDMTVTKAGHDSGNARVVGEFAFTVYHAEWFQKQGVWHAGTKGLKPGAVIFYDWSGHKAIGGIDHVGVVEKVYSDGTFDVIEGNKGDECVRVRRDGTYVVGFGMPKYDQPKLVAPSGKPVIKTNSSGSRTVLLQRCLNKVQKAGLVDDGEFGPLTKAAVKTFQKAHKDSAGKALLVDTEYGEKSAWALAKAVG